MVSGCPRGEVSVPGAVAVIAAGRQVRAVWENELGGLTFEVGEGRGRCFVKWAPAGCGIDLAAEAARLRWAARFTPVPRLLGEGTDDTGSWLITRALPGQAAVARRWKAAPQIAVAAIGRGLRALHDALPVRDCPFSASASQRLA